MKTKILILAMAGIFTGSLFFIACQKDFEMADEATTFALQEVEAVMAEGYLIGFKERPDPAAIQAAGGNIIHTFNHFPVIHAHLPEQALAGLRRAAGIAFVEPNQFWSAMNCPTSSLICAEGQINTFHISRIGAQAAWMSGATGKGIRLAILDTGIDGNHKDLKDNLAADGFTVIKTGSPPSRSWLVDPNGHGTHVAGTAGASGMLNGSTNALLGVAPEVTLVSVRVLRENASGTWAEIAEGIDWCIDQGNSIDIINMSLSGPESSSTLELAVQKAWNAGLLLVASAGNTGETNVDDIRYPAAYEEVIAVAATNQQVDQRWYRSSIGDYVELIAPGNQVFSTHINQDEYYYMSGTSMASPHVAGVAALIWSADNTLTNQNIRDKLKLNTENLDLLFNYQGFGLARADKALGIQTGRIKGYVYAGGQTVYAASLTFSDGSNTYLTTSCGVAGYTVIIPPGTYTATASFNYGYEPVSTVVTVDADGITETDFSFTGTTPDPEPVYTISGTVTDAGDQSMLSGATVSIADSNISATTDINGYFKIDNLNEGIYTISASLSGYQPETQTNISVQANTTVYFVLKKEEVPTDPPDPAGLSINHFDLTPTSNPQFARVLVHWEVSGEDLGNVLLEISGPNNDTMTWDVSGSSAAGDHEFSFRRGFGDYILTLTVTNNSNESLSETKTIKL